MIVEEGHSTINQTSSHGCNGCGSVGVGEAPILLCSGCKSVRYCGRQCQKEHWVQHKVLCQSIQQLQRDSQEKCKKSCAFVSHMTPKQRNTVAKLIGERCLIDCHIGDVKTSALWDTGAQISLVSRGWLRANNVNKNLLDLSNILDKELTVEGVNGMKIPYEGYILLDFQVNGKEISVPFLVTKDNIKDPIIGFNVIKTLIDMATEDRLRHEIAKEVLKYCSNVVDENTVSAFVATVQSTSSVEMSAVKILKTGSTIKAGSTTTLSCKIESLVVEERTPVVFESEVDELLPNGLEFSQSLLYLKKGPNTRISVAVQNNTNKDIHLTGRL